MKLDVDRVLTVPAAPPEAGPDRALDAPPPNPCPPAALVLGGSLAAVADGDVARPKESPIAALTRAAAVIHRALLFASNRQTCRRPSCLAMGAEADQSGEEPGGGGGVASVPPEVLASNGSAVGRTTGDRKGSRGGWLVRNRSLRRSSYSVAIPKVATVPVRSWGDGCDGVEHQPSRPSGPTDADPRRLRLGERASFERPAVSTAEAGVRDRRLRTRGR